MYRIESSRVSQLFCSTPPLFLKELHPCARSAHVAHAFSPSLVLWPVHHWSCGLYQRLTQSRRNVLSDDDGCRAGREATASFEQFVRDYAGQLDSLVPTSG